jgi:hypothetical protein
MAPRDVGSFVADLLGQHIEFSYSVKQDYSVNLEFSLHGKPYSFNLTRWKGSVAQAKFLGLFFQSGQRDATEYGNITIDGDGLPVYYMTEEQRIAAVLQASRDIISTLDLIVKAFERSVLDYAVWYREKHQETNTYGELITLMCCHSIVHSYFMAPNITYPLIQFPEAII